MSPLIIPHLDVSSTAISVSDSSFDITLTKINIKKIYYTSVSHGIFKKTESKKEKIKRLANEKMLASWKVYDKKTPTTILIKQICKPQYRINNFGQKK